MSYEDPPDFRFALPAVDDPPSTEVGVVLMGLDADRLLTGLGLATLADDPALVTLAVDQLRHGAVGCVTPESLMESGVRRWRAVRGVLREACRAVPDSGALRRQWSYTVRAAAASQPDAGPAAVTYLAVCWLRRDDVDRCAAARSFTGEEIRDVPPEIPAG